MATADTDKTWIEKLQDYLAAKHAPILDGMDQINQIDALEKGPQPIVEDSTLQGLHDVMAGKSAGNEGQSSGGVGGYADGGVVGDDGQDFLKSLNNGTSGIPKFDPNSGMPPQTPQMPISRPIIPQVNTQSPQDYLATQKAKLNQFGPEQQLALSQHLNQQQQGIGARLPVALGGLADSIMQGVARAGSGGFADRIQGQQNLLAKNQTEALQNADKSNLEHQQAGMKLDEMDPKSPLSKTAQQTWGALLSRNGFTPEQITNMPASSIAALTGQTVEALKAESEAKMAAATLGLKTQEAAQTAKHQNEETAHAKVEEVDKADELKRAALKETASHPFLHPINAYKASSQLGDTALTGDNAPASSIAHVTSQAEYDALPPGTHFVDSTGQRKIKGSK